MVGTLEKTLAESFKAKNCVIGSRSVMGAIDKSKLVIVSRSASPEIAKSAKASGVPVMEFAGSSMELSRLCGRQYRISALSITKVAAATVKAIMGESEKQ